MHDTWLRENPRRSGGCERFVVAQPPMEYTGNDEVEVRVTNDMVFRYLFGRPGSERILKSLINAVRVDAGLEPVAEVEVVDSATPEEFLDGKFSSVDVRARDTVGRLINIEMQTCRQPGFVERSLYAWARAYSAQVVSGQNWKSLSPVACINILDWILINSDRDRVHHFFTPMLASQHGATQGDESSRIFGEQMGIHMIELPKLAQGRPQSRALAAWCQFLANEGRKGKEDMMKDIIHDNPDLAEADARYQEFVSDEVLRYRAYRREMAERDRISWIMYTIEEGFEKGRQKGFEVGIEQGIQQGIEQGIEKGIEKGMQQGLEKGREAGECEMIRRMAHSGMDISEISRITGKDSAFVEKCIQEGA